MLGNKKAIRLDLTDNQLALLDRLAMPSNEKTRIKRTKFVLNQYLILLAQKDEQEIIKKIKNARLLLKQR